MNDQEREVISGIFHRLEQVANQPRDPEAEHFIAEKVRQQPYAPYAMAQAIHVQEQALANLHAQVRDLQEEVDRLRRQPQGAGSFLSNLFGGGTRQPEPPRAQGHGRPTGGAPWGQPGPQTMAHGYGMPGPTGGPWGGMQPRGGGFLQSAMATAAGVAGGVMIANALSSAFGGQGAASPGGDKGNTSDAAGADQAADTGAGSTEDISAPLYQNAGYDPNQDIGNDFGGDLGDDGDWA